MIRRDPGDSLVEVVIALAVLAVILTFGARGLYTMSVGSSQELLVAKMDNALANQIQLAQASLGSQPTPAYVSCATLPQYFGQIPSYQGYSNFQTSISSISYWNGTSFSSTCSVPNSPQLLTAKVIFTPTGASKTTSFVVADTELQNAPDQLVFTTQPVTVNVNSVIATMVVAVQNSNGDTDTADTPTLALAIVPVANDNGGSLNGCVLTGASGEVLLSGCTVSHGGTYEVQAVDAADGLTADSAPFDVIEQLNEPSVQSVVPSGVGALNVAFSPPSNAPASEKYVIEACTDTGSDAICTSTTVTNPGNSQSLNVTITGLTSGTPYSVFAGAIGQNDYIASASPSAGLAYPP